MRGSLQDLVPLWIGSSKTKTVSEGYNESFWRWFGPWTGSLFARHYLCSLCSWWESVTCSIIFNLHENSRPDLQMSSTSGTSVHFNSESSTHPAIPILMAWKSHSVLATAQNHNYACDFGAPVCSGLLQTFWYFTIQHFCAVIVQVKVDTCRRDGVNWFRSWCSEASGWDRHEFVNKSSRRFFSCYHGRGSTHVFYNHFVVIFLGWCVPVG